MSVGTPNPHSMKLMALITLWSSLCCPSLGLSRNLKAGSELAFHLDAALGEPLPEAPALSVCLPCPEMQPLAVPPGRAVLNENTTHSQILDPSASCNVTDCLGNQAMPASCL